MKPIYFSTLVSLAFFITNVAVLRWILYSSKKKVAPFQTSSLVAPPSEAPTSGERVLEAENILGWEFEYARTTASEAMQDRHTMINFYLIVTGVVASGVVGLLGNSNNILDPAIGTVFLWVLCLIGWLYFLNVVRLREAWYDSARTMNRIKEFYFQYAGKLPPGSLRTAFRWQPETLPPAGKKWTVFFFSATVVGLLNSVAFVTGGVLLDLQAVKNSVWVSIILAFLGLALFAFHEWMYFALLSPPAKGGGTSSAHPNTPPPGSGPETSGERTPSLSIQETSHVQRISKQTDWDNTPPAESSEALVMVHDEWVDYRYESLFRVVRANLQYRRFDGKMSQPMIRINFERGDSVAVLLHDPQRDEVVLVRQFRYPVYASLPRGQREGERARQAWILETVAGMQDEGLSSLQVAVKELLEEAHIELVSELKPVLRFYTSPGGTSEQISLYMGLVDGHERAALEGGVTEEGEDTQVVVIPFNTAVEMVARGEIKDGKTIIALQYLALNKN